MLVMVTYNNKYWYYKKLNGTTVSNNNNEMVYEEEDMNGTEVATPAVGCHHEHNMSISAIIHIINNESEIEPSKHF